MPNVTTVAAAPSSRPVVASPFRDFQPKQLNKLGEGNFALTGQLGRMTTAFITVKNGSFSVVLDNNFPGSTVPRPPRAMTRSELEALTETISRHMKQVPGRQTNYAAVNALARKAIRSFPTTVGEAKDVVKKLVTPKATTTVSGSLWLNLMPGPGPKQAHASIQLTSKGTGAAAPKVKVTQVRVFEEGSNKLVATIAAPTVNSSKVTGKTRNVEYGVAFPPDLSSNRKYTLVLDTSVDGQPAGVVRTDFMSPARVF